MARAVFVMCICYILLALTRDVHGIGVNWGSMTSHPITPSIVVAMLKDNQINKVKLFESDSWTVDALAGSGIEVTLAIPNDKLKDLADDYDNAKDWVKENVTKHVKDGRVDVKYVAVGNEPLLKSYNGTHLTTIVPALKNIQKALNEAGHGDKIKATVPNNADVYESPSNKPSDGVFRSDVKNLMLDMVKFLDEQDAPFMTNIYPFLSLYTNDDFPVDFAFSDDKGDPIEDKNIEYKDVFDANFDTLVWALKKSGYPKMKIVVGEVGWPTSGDKNASPELAKRFYDGFLKKWAANKGTPLRPGPMEVYLFGLFDEDLKSIEPGNFERHWGIFRYDGQPKFAIDFTGKGQNRFPVAAKGVKYLQPQWCVFKRNTDDPGLIAQEISYACSMSDCTNLGYGGCGKLDSYGNISYAFNIYFQQNDQSVEACNFNGLAEIVTRNASTQTCLFPLQIESAGERIRYAFGASIILGILVAFFLIL